MQSMEKIKTFRSFRLLRYESFKDADLKTPKAQNSGLQNNAKPKISQIPKIRKPPISKSDGGSYETVSHLGVPDSQGAKARREECAAMGDFYARVSEWKAYDLERRRVPYQKRLSLDGRFSWKSNISCHFKDFQHSMLGFLGDDPMLRLQILRILHNNLSGEILISFNGPNSLQINL
ncbi:hypothetical protein SUGI_1006450 [Cryptomeria japonica]|nr:hypothetical protein SUGI_1006450 [Cryptomeria japonica]